MNNYNLTLVLVILKMHDMYYYYTAACADRYGLRHPTASFPQGKAIHCLLVMN